MNKKCKYKKGDVFGHWTLIEYKKEQRQWLAVCICEKIKLVHINHLVSGKSISCSCQTKHSHRMTGSPEYRSWSGAKSKCICPSNDRYDSYGGRGITMCDTWLNSFEQFYLDMGKRPIGTSLDRIDNNGNYSKENCRWATAKEQMRNRRGHEKYGISITELAEKFNIPYGRLQTRLKRGWSLEDATTIALVKGKKSYRKRGTNEQLYAKHGNQTGANNQ